MHPSLPTSPSGSWVVHLNVLGRPRPARSASFLAGTLPEIFILQSAIRALPAAILGLILTKAGGS
jgi:hypothetical protein